MVAVSDCPALKVGVVTVVVLPPKQTPLLLQDPKATPADSTSVMTTLFAVPVPVFMTRRV